MSYDLVFWKQTPKCSATPLDICSRLMDGKPVDGLETIPIDQILARVQTEFPGIQAMGGLVFWEDEKRGFFEIYTSDQHVHFCCRQLLGSEMNRLIDIAAEFHCPLYDPQDDKRYA